VIGALLDRVEVPPPGPTFWADLQTRLESGARVAELHPADRPTPRVVRRRRAVAAVAAAVAVVLIAVLVSRAGDDDEKVVPTDSSTTTTGPTSTSEGGADSPVPPLITSAVTTWIDAVTSGSIDAAWQMVGPQSRDALGSQAAFAQLMADSLPQSWAPFTSPGVERRAVLLSPPGDDQLWVVRLATAHIGEVRALAVRRTGTAFEVEPFVPGPALSLISLPAGQVPADATIPVHVDSDAKGSIVAIDGTAPEFSELTQDATGAIISIRPHHPLSPGRHDILVAEVTGTGALAVDDQTFEVAAR
jgi:hypothetical protein